MADVSEGKQRQTLEEIMTENNLQIQEVNKLQREKHKEIQTYRHHINMIKRKAGEAT